MKKIIIAALLFLMPCGVFAQSNWEFKQEGSAISFQGDCAGNQAKIEFFSNEKDKNPAKTIDTDCTNGKFFHAADFSKSDLPEGNYIIAIDGEKSQNVVSVMKSENITKKNLNNMQSQPQVESPEIKFLNAFVSVQQSILDMRSWLVQTNYPDLVKKALGGALDGVDFAIGKVSELVLSAESGNTTAKDDTADTAKTEQAEEAKVNNAGQTDVPLANSEATADNPSTSGATAQSESATNSNTNETNNAAIIDTTSEGLTASDSGNAATL
jgi:hypothetical protein